MSHRHAGFGDALSDTLRRIFRDKGVVLLVLISPLLYGFFYPWPYTNEVVQRAPVAIIDADHSDLSRLLLRYAQASPHLDVRVLDSEAQAQQALWHRDIVGYALLPAGLKRDVSRGRTSTVSIVGDGNALLLNKAVLTGFGEAVGTVSAGIELRRMHASGMSPTQADIAREPLPLRSSALFNVNQGYGSSVVPAVAMMVLQQTLLMGAAMLLATWRESGTVVLPAGAGVWAGRVLALALPNMLMGLVYFFWLFAFLGYAHGGNPWAALLLIVLQSTSVAAWACVLGWWIGNRERVMQVLVFSALPLFFLSGYSWPAQALPWVLQGLRWLSPSTATIAASTRLNQMGASFADVTPLLGVLAAHALLALTLLCVLGRKRQQAQDPPLANGAG